VVLVVAVAILPLVEPVLLDKAQMVDMGVPRPHRDLEVAEVEQAKQEDPTMLPHQQNPQGFEFMVVVGAHG
jgi:hypothetical protein